MKRIDLRTLFASRRNKIIAAAVVVVFVLGGSVLYQATHRKKPEAAAPASISNKSDLEEAHKYLKDQEDQENQTSDDMVELDQQF